MRKRRESDRRSGTSAELTRRHRPDYQIIMCIGLLVLVGLMVLFAISPYQIHRINLEGGDLDQSHYMLKQLLYLGIGASAFIAGAILPFSFWKRHSAKLLLGAFGLCLLLAILGAFQAPPAMCFNGACRWYNLGFTSFQPAEMLKFALLLFVAGYLGKRIQQNAVNSVSDTLVPIGIVAGVSALFVVVFQKDMGTGITMLGILASMLVVSGLRGRLLAMSGAVLAGFGVLLVIFSPHRIDRITTFFNTSSATDAGSYHIEMAKLAIGSGGLTGRGLGNGVQAFGYLPEALNDSIFAVLGETFGLIGLIAIIGIFAVLLRRLIIMVDYLNDPTMQMIAAGVFGWLATHVIVNIGAMTGVFPLTGVTLPFLSFGGTSLLFMMMALGVAYQVSRYTSHSQTERINANEAPGSGGRFRRTRDASSRRYQRASSARS